MLILYKGSSKPFMHSNINEFIKQCDECSANVFVYFFFSIPYSIGSRTDGPNQEKKKRWRQGTSSARQTSLGVLSGEVCFLRGSSFGSSPLQTSGNTPNVFACPIKRWKTTWKFQLISRSSLLVPMFHPDQFKRRLGKSARLSSYGGGLRRYQPYWM